MLKHIALHRIFLLLALSLSLGGCTHEYFYQEHHELPGAVWAIDEPQQFSFSTQDTSSYLDFYLDLRNTDDYPYQNIYTFIQMEFPNGRSLRDTMHFPYLASDEGRWMGSGFGGSFDNSIKYKHRKKLPLPGDYKITVTHAMRAELLPGMSRVGIHIEASHD